MCLLDVTELKFTVGVFSGLVSDCSHCVGCQQT